jgi:hypothetical protein
MDFHLFGKVLSTMHVTIQVELLTLHDKRQIIDQNIYDLKSRRDRLPSFVRSEPIQPL